MRGPQLPFPFLLPPVAAALVALPAAAKLAPAPGEPRATRPVLALLRGERDPARVSPRADRPGWDRGTVRGGRLSPVVVDGGVLFRYRDREAQDVSVVGRFNDWDEDATPLRRGRDGLWRTVIDLDDGEWPYVYVVDGRWLDDPDNPVSRRRAPGEPDRVWKASLVEIKHGEVVRPRPPGFREATITLSAGYDRVDQVSLRPKLSYENPAQLHPYLDLEAGYSFGRDRWLYDVSFRQPLFRADFVAVGASAYRVTDSPDRHRIGSTENTLAAFFFREDWRDYHEAEGVATHATVHLGSALELEARWKSEEHRSISKTTDWGLFGGAKRMRPNPPADEGELRSVSLRFELDTRNSTDNPTRGVLTRGGFEWVGGDLGGDFEFRRALLDFRRFLKLSRHHFFDFRIAGGRIDGALRGKAGGEITGFEAIPSQEIFYLGGTGTMRATNFKSMRGDRMLLANAEMRLEIREDFQIVIFTDIGDAWEDAGEDFDAKTDAGLGFQDSDSTFRINFAAKIDDRDDDRIFISARIRRMF